MGVAALVMVAVAGVVKAVGQYKAGKAEAAQAEYNAQVALQAAYDERLRAREKVTDVRRGRSIMTGRARGGTGGSGVSVESGSVEDVLDSTAMMAELDVLRVGSNAERAAWGLEVKASQFRAAGSVARHRAGWQAAGTLIQTAGTVASMKSKQ